MIVLTLPWRKKEDPCGKGERRLLASYARGSSSEHGRKEMPAVVDDQPETSTMAGRRVLNGVYSKLSREMNVEQVRNEMLVAHVEALESPK